MMQDGPLPTKRSDPPIECIPVGGNEELPAWLRGIEGEALPHLISSNAPYIRVVAGPGSGKTTGLKRRIHRLVAQDGVPLSRIFVGTFTRAIASELADALGKAVADSSNEELGLRISTLHSHALLLVRSHPAARGGRALRFLLDFEKAVMLYDV